MRVALVALLALVAGCASPKSYEDMSPEERAAYLDYQKKRVDLYVEFAHENAEKFIEAGKWKRDDVELAYTLAADAVTLYFAWRNAEEGTPDQQYAVRLALEEAALKFVSLGIDRALG